MDPAVALKFLTDISIYLAFAGLVLPSAGAALPAFFAVLSALGCYLVEEKKPLLRALCFLPAAVVLIVYVRSLSAAILALPPFIYAAYAAWTGRVSTDRDEFSMYFKPVAAMLCVALLLGLFFDREGVLVLQNALPMTAVALFFGTILLRTLRHTESTRREPRFILVNLAAPVGALIAAFVLYQAGFLTALGAGLSFFYEKVVYPLLLGLAYAIYGVIWVFQKGFEFLFRSRIKEPAEEEPAFLGELGGEAPSLDAGEGSPLVDQILTALLILIGLALIILLFRRMLGSRAARSASSGAEERGRANSAKAQPRGFSPFAPRQPEELVRRLFQKLMLKARAGGGVLTPTMTSERICGIAGEVYTDAEAIHAFRALYLAARYGGVIEKSDLKHARTLYDRILKSELPRSERQR